MLRMAILIVLPVFLFTVTPACSQSEKIDYRSEILEHMDVAEYDRLMALTLDEFDQSSIGFRQHSGDYALVQLLIPEYISVNQLEDNYARNLHWHLGQIHAFNENNDAAIAEMKQSFSGGSITWECYVTGSIAFLEGDKATLEDALARLRQQENQMNIHILENFVKHFDKGYVEAYSMGY